ncbi:MAG: hypothetical protein KatS3mg077_1774 [Candidatus Binatia bacterium]|nr:MAG: hypothetical protein KatS3mg077_1774 [Candidatus Binatia bacterium]
MIRGLWPSLALVLLAACGEDARPPVENYGNLLESPAGLVLVAEEHPSGWGRADCFLCHLPDRMHRVNRTGISDLDLAFIRSVVRNQGEASCAACHGDNGVAP